MTTGIYGIHCRASGKKFVGCRGFPGCTFSANADRYKAAEFQNESNPLMDEMVTPLVNFSCLLAHEARDSENAMLLVKASHVIRILTTYLREWRKLEDPSTLDAIDRAVQQVPKECKDG